MKCLTESWKVLSSCRFYEVSAFPEISVFLLGSRNVCFFILANEMQTDFVDLFLMSKLVALDFRDNISDELTLPFFRESAY